MRFLGTAEMLQQLAGCRDEAIGKLSLSRLSITTCTRINTRYYNDYF